MIGLDTNIIVRYLTQDDPVQSPKATALIENEITERNPGFVSVVAIAETAWVLKRVYGLRDDEIAADLEGILRADTMVVQNEREVFRAVAALGEGYGSFADVLIEGLNAKAGCVRTVTFDRQAVRLPGFRLL